MKNKKKIYTVNINQKNYLLNNNSLSIIQICELLQIKVPRFCYHKKLSIAGNCRMCLIELELNKTQKKPIIACGTYITTDTTKLYTNTRLVNKIRKNILELLLINHPLDCPICDQGGECDLQDQTMIYGNDRTRFLNLKRTSIDQNLGTYIKSIMTRCIHCTRCIRYFNEIIGEHQLGIFGRGTHSEVGTYKNKNLDSEIIGNVIDLCPVGALTSKPFSFSARSWELIGYESIDILDATCSHIKIDTKGDVIHRVTPVLNSNLNEEWISDKIRFSYDSYKLQRLFYPYIKSIKNNKYYKCSFEKSFIYIKQILSYLKKQTGNSNCYFFSGDLVDTNTEYLFKLMLRNLGYINLNVHFDKDVDLRNNFVMNTTYNEIERYSLFFVCGINTKIESTILNIRLKKTLYKKDNAILFYLGTTILLNYNKKHIGLSSEYMIYFYFGKTFLCKYFLNYKKVCYLSNNSFMSEDIIFNLFLNKLNNKLNIEIKNNYITLFSQEIIAYELNSLSTIRNKIDNNWSDYESELPKFIYYLNYDNLNNIYTNSTFIVYHGHHADIGVKKANIILPSCSYLETENIYINSEGILKLTFPILTSYGLAIDNNTILYCLWKYLNNENKNNKLQTFILENIIYKKINKSLKQIKVDFSNILTNIKLKRSYVIEDSIYVLLHNNFYNLDIISRTSNNITKYLLQKKMKKQLNFF